MWSAGSLPFVRRSTSCAMSDRPYGPSSYAANIPCVSMSAMAMAPFLPSEKTIARAPMRSLLASPWPPRPAIASGTSVPLPRPKPPRLTTPCGVMSRVAAPTS